MLAFVELVAHKIARSTASWGHTQVCTPLRPS